MCPKYLIFCNGIGVYAQYFFIGHIFNMLQHLIHAYFLQFIAWSKSDSSFWVIFVKIIFQNVGFDV